MSVGSASYLCHVSISWHAGRIHCTMPFAPHQTAEHASITRVVLYYSLHFEHVLQSCGERDEALLIRCLP